VELPHLLRHIRNAFGFADTDGQATEAGDVFWTMAGAYPTAIFIKVPVDHIRAAILDAPVPPVDVQEPLGVSLLRRATGDAIGEFGGVLARFLVEALALDEKDLADMGEVQVVVEGGTGPDVARLNAPVFQRRTFHEVRLLSPREMEGDILEQSGGLPLMVKW